MVFVLDVTYRQKKTNRIKNDCWFLTGVLPDKWYNLNKVLLSLYPVLWEKTIL